MNIFNQVERISIVGLIVALSGPVTLANGGWSTQTIELAEGWNLVWLEVEPAEAESHPATVFGANAISVHGFIAGRGIGDRGAWVSYHAAHPAYVSSLTSVQGDRGYFVLASTAEDIAVTGRPMRRSRPQSAGAPALFGASVTSSPTFGDYFKIGDAIDRVATAHKFDPTAGSPEDAFESLTLPTSTIESNAAYWLTTSIDQDYAGPLRINTAAGGLQFGKNHYALDVTIEVPLGGATVSVNVLGSATPPAGEPTDASADTSWLQYRNQEGEWQSFDAPLVVSIAPNETKAVIVLRADRKDKEQACIDPGGSLYQALIEFTDDAGHREVIGAGMEVLNHTTGTWMGDVTLANVSLNRLLLSPPPPDPPPPTPAKPMRFGLLLEIPEAGAARILDKVCMAVDATYDLNDEVEEYTKFSMFRSVMFPKPVLLNGSYDGALTLLADHPLNPYRHRFNPEHVAGYEIRREINIDITPAGEADPAPGNSFLGDLLSERTGNNVLVGTYTETISGLGNESIEVSGTFRLVRLSEDTGLQECPQ